MCAILCCFIFELSVTFQIPVCVSSFSIVTIFITFDLLCHAVRRILYYAHIQRKEVRAHMHAAFVGPKRSKTYLTTMMIVVSLS